MTSIIVCTIFVAAFSTNAYAEGRNPVLSRYTKARMGYFDQELFQAVTNEFQGQNIVLSPITVRLVLTMLMEGSEGLAREQIRRALRLTKDLDITRENMKTFLAARRHTQSDEEDSDLDVSLDMSARVFVASGQKVNQKYANTLREHYDSNLEEVDMDDHEKAAEAINSWVNMTTKGMIPTIINADQVNSDTAVVLASAIYFESVWRKPFEDTHIGCFNPSAAKCTKAIFMRQNEFHLYADVKALNSQVIELSYNNPRFSMLIMVPYGDVKDLLRDLPHVPIANIVDELDMKQVDLSVPRFTAESGQDITNILRKLEVTEAFSPTAILNAVEAKSNRTYRVESVFHSAKVIVNERGTTAAAAASLQIRPNMNADLDNVTVTIDRPFVFFVRDSATRMVLFAGVVTKLDHCGDECEMPVTQTTEDPTTQEATSQIPFIMNKVEAVGVGATMHTSPPPVYRNGTVRPSPTDPDSEEEI